MDEQRALEAALVANPDDLAAHAAYADLLHERDDPATAARGEFIQLALELERTARPRPRQASTEEWENDWDRWTEQTAPLRQRQKEIQERYEREWLDSLWPHLYPTDLSRFSPGRRVQYKRGWIDTLHLLQFDPALAREAQRHPLLRLLRDFAVEHPEDATLELLSGAEWLPRLRVLRLGPSCALTCHVQRIDVVPLVPRMARLEELTLVANELDLHELFALPVPTLRALTLNHQTAYPLDVLAANPTLGRLTRLSIHPAGLLLEYGDPTPAPITLDGFRALVRSPHLSALTHLDLRNSDAGDEGCAELVASGILRRLVELDLSHGRITDEGARVLAACPDLARLELLTVHLNGLTQAGLDLLEQHTTVVSGEQCDAQQLDWRSYLYEQDME